MLATLLGSETRARVLTIFLAQPRQAYHLREVIRMAGGGASSVQREVQRLERLGLLTSQRTPSGRRLLQVVDAHELLAPLRALVELESAAGVSAGVAVDHADIESAVHPSLRPCMGALLATLGSGHVERAVLFGSATQPDADEPPRDLDLVVRLVGPAEGRASRFFALRRALECVTGLPVDLVEEEAIDNPYLRDEIERTGVILVAAA
jgi:predicted nucleotidyltransferase/DNA-binding MarR family transcriptional regulator